MKKTKILIIDDSASLRASLREMLPDSTDIIEATNGIEGLKQIQANPPNLVLLDCQMPKMDGIEVYRRLQSHAHFRRIPVVLMSGSQDEVIPLLNRLPMDYEFLSKPFRQAQLLQASHEAMKRARKLAELPPQKAQTTSSASATTPDSRGSGQDARLSPSAQAAALTNRTPSQTAQAKTAESDAWSNQRLQLEVQRLQNKNETLEREMLQLRQQLQQVVKVLRSPAPAPQKSPAIV